MGGPLFNVLFLCTGNSARSVMAEALLNALGAGRFRAFSAGSRPVGTVNPYALEVLQRQGYRVEELRSKSWDEFAAPGAPQMDAVITVCGSAAGEACPVWPGEPATAHWELPDPAALAGTEAETRALFAEVYREIETRLIGLVSLPVETLDRASLRDSLADAGRPRLEEGD